MRTCLWIAIFACCSNLYSQTRAEKALDEEPEMQEIVKLTGIKTNPGYATNACPPTNPPRRGPCMTAASVVNGVVQSMNATKAVYIWEGRLRHRLKQELLYNTCGDKCPVEKQEIVLLQQMIDKDDPKNDPSSTEEARKSWKGDEDGEWGNRGDGGGAWRKGEAWSEIFEYCATIGGDRQQKLPDGPEKEAATKRVTDCEASYNIRPGDFRQPDGGPAEVAHQAIWAQCVKEFYDRSKSVYDQPAYNSCMNKRDIPTQLCTKLRAFLKLQGSCPGPQPRDVQDLGLGLPPR